MLSTLFNSMNSTLSLRRNAKLFNSKFHQYTQKLNSKGLIQFLPTIMEEFPSYANYDLIIIQDESEFLSKFPKQKHTRVELGKDGEFQLFKNQQVQIVF